MQSRGGVKNDCSLATLNPVFAEIIMKYILNFDLQYLFRAKKLLFQDCNPCLNPDACLQPCRACFCVNPVVDDVNGLLLPCNFAVNYRLHFSVFVTYGLHFSKMVKGGVAKISCSLATLNKINSVAITR